MKSCRTAITPARGRTDIKDSSGKTIESGKWTAVLVNNHINALLDHGLVSRCTEADELVDPNNLPTDWNDLSGFVLPDPVPVPTPSAPMKKDTSLDYAKDEHGNMVPVSKETKKAMADQEKAEKAADEAEARRLSGATEQAVTIDAADSRRIYDAIDGAFPDPDAYDTLTIKQKLFVDALAMGQSLDEAFKFSGYSPNAKTERINDLLSHNSVTSALAVKFSTKAG